MHATYVLQNSEREESATAAYNFLSWKGSRHYMRGISLGRKTDVGFKKEMFVVAGFAGDCMHMCFSQF